MNRPTPPKTFAVNRMRAALLAAGAILLLCGGDALAKAKPPAAPDADAAESDAPKAKDAKKKSPKGQGKDAKAPTKDPKASAKDPKATAKDAKASTKDPKAADKDAKASAKDAKTPTKSHSLGKFNDWEALATVGKDKTCYALGAPAKRQPENKLKDAQANMFVSTRPGEGVRNEVAITLGYATKDNSIAVADIDGDNFDLVTMGVNAWLKNPAKEKEFVEALKGGAKLVVKASSAKGIASTDTYSLKGLSDALARVQQECK
jgi:hypothetical protein